MSSQSVAFANPQHVSESSEEQGGSPADLETREDGAEVEEAGDEGGEETPESPETETAVPAEEQPKVEPGESPDDDRIATLEADLAQKSAILRDLADEMESDPALKERLSRGGRGRESSNGDLMSDAEKTLRDPETGLTPHSADVVLRAFGPALKRLTQLEARFGEVTPRVSELTRALGSATLERGLADNGVAPAVQRQQPFQKFMRTLRSSREFQQLEARAPAFAAEFAANKWQVSAARKGGWKDERARLETAKGEKRGGSPASGARTASLAEKVIEIARSHGGGHVDAAASLRMKYVREGKSPPPIRFVDRK